MIPSGFLPLPYRLDLTVNIKKEGSGGGWLPQCQPLTEPTRLARLI